MEPSKFVLLLLIGMVIFESRVGGVDLPGTWELLEENAGVSSIHTFVTRFNSVVLLGQHISTLFDVSTKKIRPLTIVSDTWCSSGQFLFNGTFLQTGGSYNGIKKIRMFTPCETSSVCDWEEAKYTELDEGRWYATNQILPNGSVIIIGGLAAFSHELFPQTNGIQAVHFPFLADSKDDQIDNLYPFIHLLPNGHLFVFANNRSILYDHENNLVLKEYPQLGGGPRNYPSAGSSAMLALTGNYSSATIIVCGGAEYGAVKYQNTSAPAQSSCGRIEAMGENPVWEMEEMSFGRIMSDMVMLPTGDILIINGAQAGTQGFDMASKPCLNPVLYKPDGPVGSRFTTLKSGTVPRMYHSTANLLQDGRVLLAGSNTHLHYNFTAEFPTELRLEAFSPEYLSLEKKNMSRIIVDSPQKIHYGHGFHILVTGTAGDIPMEVNIASVPLATHSFSQGQRLVKLLVLSAESNEFGQFRFECMAPPDGKVAPPGYYMLFLVNKGVPSEAKWVQLL